MSAATLVEERTLHLVDIENLAGGGNATTADVTRAFADYLALARWQPGDLVFVAANPGLVLRFAWAPPVECNVRAAVGEDGADLMLLAQAAPDFVRRRCGRLVIGSGDHAFIERALHVRATGVGVVVVARAGCIARGWHAHGFPVLELEAASPVAA